MVAKDNWFLFEFLLIEIWIHCQCWLAKLDTLVKNFWQIGKLINFALTILSRHSSDVNVLFQHKSSYCHQSYDIQFCLNSESIFLWFELLHVFLFESVKIEIWNLDYLLSVSKEHLVKYWVFVVENNSEQKHCCSRACSRRNNSIVKKGKQN